MISRLITWLNASSSIEATSLESSTQEGRPDPRVDWVDSIRVCATFGVVLVHVAGPILNQFNQLPLVYWWAGNLYDSSARMVSLLFLMLSGYLLLGRQESLDVVFRRRVLKVALPLLFWSTFYVIWSLIWGMAEQGMPKDSGLVLQWSRDWGMALARSLVGMLFKPAAIHLWYLFVICGLYLMLPFLRWLVQSAQVSADGRRIQATIIGLWFTGIVLLPVIERGLLELGLWQEGLWDPVTGWNSLYDPGLILRYSGYLVVGYWLGQVRPGNRQFWGATGLALLAVGLTAGGTFWLTARNQGELDVFFYRRTMPNVLLLAVCSWQMIRFLVELARRTSETQALRLTTGVIRRLAQLSLGIYLLHPVCVDILMRGVFGVKLDALTFHPLLGIPLTTLVVFSMSAGLTWLLKRIPGAKWVLP